MKAIGYFLLLGLAVLVAPSFAASDLSEVLPGRPQHDLPFTFDVSTKRLPTGDVEFIVNISENAGYQLPTIYRTYVGVVKLSSDGQTLPVSSEERQMHRKIPSKQAGNVITCEFTATAKELENPNFAFDLTIPAPNHMGAFDAYYLKLKKFLKP